MPTSGWDPSGARRIPAAGAGTTPRRPYAVDGTLIVGVDGSPPSIAALDWAADEAERGSLALRVVHASGWEWYEGHEPSFGINREAVRAQADREADHRKGHEEDSDGGDHLEERIDPHQLIGRNRQDFGEEHHRHEAGPEFRPEEVAVRNRRGPDDPAPR